MKSAIEVIEIIVRVNGLERVKKAAEITKLAFENLGYELVVRNYHPKTVEHKIDTYKIYLKFHGYNKSETFLTYD